MEEIAPLVAALDAPPSHAVRRGVITGAQIRAARALLRWRIVDLAAAADISVPTAQRSEVTDGIPRMQARNLAAVELAFMAAGVEFTDGGGVRLRGGGEG